MRARLFIGSYAYRRVGELGHDAGFHSNSQVCEISLGSLFDESSRKGLTKRQKSGIMATISEIDPTSNVCGAMNGSTLT